MIKGLFRYNSFKSVNNVISKFVKEKLIQL